MPPFDNSMLLQKICVPAFALDHAKKRRAFRRKMEDQRELDLLLRPLAPGVEYINTVHEGAREGGRGGGEILST